jgi:hypothetical protein
MKNTYFWSDWPEPLKLFYLVVGAEVSMGLAASLVAGAIVGNVPPGNYWIVAVAIVVAALLGIAAHHMSNKIRRYGALLFWAFSFVALVIGVLKGMHVS